MTVKKSKQVTKIMRKKVDAMVKYLTEEVGKEVSVLDMAEYANKIAEEYDCVLEIKFNAVRVNK